MNTKLFSAVIVSLSLVLSSCEGVAATPAAGDTISGIYTSVALTVGPQNNSVDSSAVTLITSTPVLLASPTQVYSTPTYPIVFTPTYVYSNGCDGSAYVSDLTIPDDTDLATGETFVKTWKLKNTGSCTWNADYSLSFYDGDSMDGSDTPIDETIGPGEDAEISVTLTAPDTEGTYTGYWVMTNKAGVNFGQPVYVRIVVYEEVATSTPTSTSSATTTFTVTPTDTATVAPATPPTDAETPTPNETPLVQDDSADE